jgi:peroxiredoxin
MKLPGFAVAIFIHVSVFAQSAKPLYQGSWKGQLHRQDGNLVEFNFETKRLKDRWQIVIRNAAERIVLHDVTIRGDSVLFAMPVFESEFRTQIQPDGSLKGLWYKGTALQTQRWTFTALPGIVNRFELSNGKAKQNLSGRWAVSINRPNGGARPAIAEFTQKGNIITGTFLTPSGDYRYLEGIVTGNLFRMSVFDGAHAYLFKANVNGAGRLDSGFFYSGYAGVETWEARKDPRAELPDVGNVPQLKPGADRLDFSFPDLDRNMVSIGDARFKNKVVIIQLMGSWCPNCMDETKFLNDYYLRNRQRGVEVLALAYEYSTDFERSRISLDKFRKLYKVQYPMLITGAWINDTLRTEKTLPQITPIKAFPTTIYIGKDGKIKKIETGFAGPGTGLHYETFRKEFEATVSRLLKE